MNRVLQTLNSIKCPVKKLLMSGKAKKVFGKPGDNPLIRGWPVEKLLVAKKTKNWLHQVHFQIVLQCWSKVSHI